MGRQDSSSPQNQNQSLMDRQVQRSVMTRSQGSKYAQSIKEVRQDRNNMDSTGTLQRAISKTRCDPLEGISYQVHKSVEISVSSDSNNMEDVCDNFVYYLPRGLEMPLNFSVEERFLREN